LTLTRTVLAEANPDQDAIAQFQLTFDPARCTDCGQCIQICPESAFERSGEYLWSSLLAGERVGLRVGLIRRCARCGVGHGGSGDLCAVCAYRAANPFGSTMPPGRLNGADSARLGHPASG
jgi:ferredoxin